MKHNMNKMLAALAVAMLAGLAAPMATAHESNPCANGTTTLPDQPGDAATYGRTAGKATDEERWQVAVSDGASRTLAIGGADAGLVFEVYQMVKTAADTQKVCRLIQTGTVPDSQDNFLLDAPIVLSNGEDNSGTLEDDDAFIIHVFVPDSAPLTSVSYRIYEP